LFIKFLFASILLQPFYAFSESEGLKILVVGAGISGLGPGKNLHDSGYEVTVE
jgi:ketol-acid reductoisomerase